MSKNYSPEELAVNIFESNAVSAEGASAIFKNACYINHSCNPNADFFYREDLSALLIQAARDITKGEEIFVPLFDSSVMTREQRQDHMHESRGIPCECSACSLKGDVLRASDERRAQLAELRQLILDWNSGEGEAEDALAGVDKAYELLEKEGYKAELVVQFLEIRGVLILPSYSLGWWAGSAVQICVSLEDEEGARKYANIAIEQYAECCLIALRYRSTKFCAATLSNLDRIAIKSRC